MEKSFYASSEKANDQQLKSDFDLLSGTEWMNSLINSLPEIVAILNTERQIIFGNDVLLKLLGIENKEEILGLRPGEALSCVNAKTMNAGCGTSEKCRYCGAVNSILESQQQNKKVTKECRITTNKNRINEYLDLKVTTAPFAYQEKNYWILSIEDLTDTKRREMLEKIFFHDILNIVGSLKGVSDLLNDPENDEETSNQYIGMVNELSKELLEEILSQRVLVYAEKGDLEPKPEPVSTLAILQEPASYLLHHKVAVSKKILISSNACSLTIDTDKGLLKRVMINMLKNALEASSDGGRVILNCALVYDKVKFSIHNEGHIPASAQAQIFQRSFSTKGKGRGSGTYSMKLLTERYLKGNVGFTSSAENGTEFFVTIPYE